MKNRTIIGIICVLLALVTVFLVAPLVNQNTTDTVDVIRLKHNISRGTEITTNHLEVAKVKGDSIPNGVINDYRVIVGKYAASDLYAGDYITAAKLTSNATSAEDVFVNLDGKVAISVPITSFSGGLSGKLQNGDIIRFYVSAGNDEIAYVPGGLQWVKVITTTTGGGVDQDEIKENDDGSHDMPSTVTVLANELQAKMLAEYSGGYDIHLVLVYRGEEVVANDYLAKQDKYFEDLAAGLIQDSMFPSGNGGNGGGLAGDILDGVIWNPSWLEDAKDSQDVNDKDEGVG